MILNGTGNAEAEPQGRAPPGLIIFLLWQAGQLPRRLSTEKIAGS